MSSVLAKKPKRVLEPVDRLSEFLFGLIMVLTLTCTSSTVDASRRSVRAMLMEVLACNVAWGIIDAFFYLLGCLAERGKNIDLLKKIRRTSDPVEASRLVSDALPPLGVSLLDPQEIESLTSKLARIPESTVWPRLTQEDLLGALAVFLLVFLSLFPVVIPFIFINDPLLATRISNGVALVLLFLAGYSFGRFTNHNSWRAGFAMVLFGAAVVYIAILLGG